MHFVDERQFVVVLESTLFVFLMWKKGRLPLALVLRAMQLRIVTSSELRLNSEGNWSI